MIEITEIPFSLPISDTAILRGDIRWKKNTEKKFPVVIICHGFKAFKDWGPFPYIGQYFAQQNFVSITFNFSHNGIGEHLRKFSEPEKFSNNTFSLELRDVEFLLEAITKEKLPCSFIDGKNIFFAGHSRGGGIAIIKAKEEHSIKAVAAWSTVSHFDRYTDEQKERWRKNGSVLLHSISPNNPYRLTTALLDDLEKNAERLNILKAVEHLQKPLLLIHGTADIPVKIEEAKKLYEVSDKSLTEFIVLENVGHMYGAKHPYKIQSPTLEHILELTVSWFNKHLL